MSLKIHLFYTILILVNLSESNNIHHKPDPVQRHPPQSPHPPYPVNGPSKEISSSNTLFTTSIYKTVKKDKTNVVFSPFIFLLQMTQIMYGAKGLTKDTIKNGLRLGAETDIEILSSLSKDLNSFNEQGQWPCTIRFPIRILIPFGYIIQKETHQVLTKLFHSSLEQVDFSNPNTCNYINTWIKESTDSRLQRCFPPMELGAQSRIVLASSFHFRGSWMVQFNPKDTDVKLFRNGKVQTRVAYMKKIGHFPFAQVPTLGARALQLPFGRDRISLIILLPYPNTNLEEMMEKIKSFHFSKIAFDMRRKIHLELPKFRFTSTIDLKPVFDQLGLQSITNQNFADFTNLATYPTPNATTNLYVTSALQKVNLDINEFGSGQSFEPTHNHAYHPRADFTNGNRAQFPNEFPVKFFVNKPFFFYLYDSTTKAILLAGSISRPMYGNKLQLN